ncbi:XRE family transcriptional regulator [bacterium 1xD8-48]|jgi:putative transcriptional regulator|nr:helix-turn-helix transcriptional regulator [Lachnospiraceae bacterium]NBJ96057.1 XRE family transcriptional regulator [bacterium 1xD8-48]
MAVSYKKLWKLLIDRNMKKKDLRTAANISTTTLARLGKDENVSTEILSKICTALNCDVGDIMEMVPDDIRGSENE